ncbi:hypothetical protein [Desulfoplanes sp.]
MEKNVAFKQQKGAIFLAITDLCKPLTGAANAFALDVVSEPNVSSHSKP